MPSREVQGLWLVVKGRATKTARPSQVAVQSSPGYEELGNPEVNCRLHQHARRIPLTHPCRCNGTGSSGNTPATALTGTGAAGSKFNWMCVQQLARVRVSAFPLTVSVTQRATLILQAGLGTLSLSPGLQQGERRTPDLGGRKPWKVKLSVGRPDATRAVTTAQAPGRGVTRTPAAMAAPGGGRIGCHRGRHKIGCQRGRYKIGCQQGRQQIVVLNDLW